MIKERHVGRRYDRALVCPMRVRVGGCVVGSPPGLGTYAEERVRSVLDHLERRVECLAITLDPGRPGPDEGTTRCRVWARLKTGRQLREDVMGADPYSAVDGAAEALARDVEYLESRLPPGTDLRCA